MISLLNCVLITNGKVGLDVGKILRNIDYLMTASINVRNTRIDEYFVKRT
jgi:hypothetical protein